jgi:hypothetical protein
VLEINFVGLLLLIRRDLYGQGVLFQLQIMEKIMKKGLILATTPVESIKKGDI